MRTEGGGGLTEPVHGDPWAGLSADLIGRFADFLCTGADLSVLQRTWLVCELLRFDAWMQAQRQRTLVSAQPADLMLYAHMHRREGAPAGPPELILAWLGRFYSFLRDSGCRADNPVAQLPPPAPLQTGVSACGAAGR